MKEPSRTKLVTKFETIESVARARSSLAVKVGGQFRKLPAAILIHWPAIMLVNAIRREQIWEHPDTKKI